MMGVFNLLLLGRLHGLVTVTLLLLLLLLLSVVLLTLQVMHLLMLLVVGATVAVLLPGGRTMARFIQDSGYILAAISEGGANDHSIHLQHHQEQRRVPALLMLFTCHQNK